jgi:phosphoribosylformylglycinamidine synthase PurS subunit
MKYRVKVEVSLKDGHSDPEGETTAQSLKELKYSLESVKVSKVYTIDLNANSMKEAETNTEKICRQLLANPTKDTYSFTIEEIK